MKAPELIERMLPACPGSVDSELLAWIRQKAAENVADWVSDYNRRELVNAAMTGDWPPALTLEPALNLWLQADLEEFIEEKQAESRIWVEGDSETWAEEDWVGRWVAMWTEEHTR